MEACSSAEMDGSVAALFVEPRAPLSLQSSLQDHSEQSLEDLKHLLVRATADLESTRTQAKLYENELHHFKNLLRSVRQERDEAREEVLKLKESFFSSGLLSNAITRGKSSNPNNSGFDLHLGDAREYSLHIQHSSKASSSPGQHMQLDCISSSIMLDASRTHLSDLHWDLHDLPALHLVDPILPDVQSNNLSPLFCSAKTGVISLDMDQQSDHHMQQESAIFSEANELLEQEVQACYQGNEESSHLVSTEFNIDEVSRPQMGSMHQWAPVGVDLQQEEVNQIEQQNLSTTTPTWRSDEICLASQPRSPVKEHNSFTELPSEVNDLHELLSCSGGAGGLAPWQAAQHGNLQISKRSTAAAHVGDTTDDAVPYVPPKHLPEPPESNLEMMLKSLPERGKLLEAVMQAGPLLQTLLLAGPLPRWRRPPPATPMDSLPDNTLMMQCMSNINNNMQKSWFSGVAPMPSSSASSMIQAGESSKDMNKSNGMDKSGSGGMAAAGTVTLPTTPSMAWMATASTSTMVEAATARSKVMRAAEVGVRSAAKNIASNAYAPKSGMETLLSTRSRKQSSRGASAPIMLNTSTNLSYSDRLLRSSALLPKRLIFPSNKQPATTHL